MPKKKYYNPQDDVVQIVDGRRVPVRSYDMYQAMHAGPVISKSVEKQQTADKPTSTEKKSKDLETEIPRATPQKQENEKSVPKEKEEKTKKPSVSLRFDGQRLTLVENRGDITTEYSVPAVSGKPDENGQFDYSKERQRMADVGPHPEGVFSVNGNGIFYRKDNPAWNNALGYVGRGKFPGGVRSWGVGKLEINMTPEQKERTGRDDTTIHGGSEPGSRGCIDIMGNDQEFFAILEKLGHDNPKIPLIVDYSRTPQKVTFPKK